MIEIEKGSTNVYADLDMKDAASMLTKAKLANKINQAIKSKKLTQKQASTIVGISQPKLSRLLRGHFHGISETKMLGIIAALGHEVHISISNSAVNKAQPIKVSFADHSPLNNSQ